MDLAGNTFWEFKDAMNANRYRRIAQYSPKTQYSDIKISRKLCTTNRVLVLLAGHC